MSLSGTRLKTNLAADILTQLNTIFPTDTNLLAAEKTLINTAKQNIANAIANAAGPDVVTEVLNAVVTVTSVSGVTPGGGTSGPGAGTVS